jgi:hypothetical protein
VSSPHPALDSTPAPESATVGVIAGVLRWLNATALLESAVGITWQALFAGARGDHVAWSRRVLLFAGLWLVYTADRWLDARNLVPTPRTSYRHRFAHEHSRALAVCWLVVLMSSVGFAVTVLSAAEWRRGVLLVLGAVAYTVCIHFGRRRLTVLAHAGVKEVAVAGLFTLGITLFSARTESSPLTLLAPNLAFFGLALLNLVWIAELERQQDRAHALASIAQGPVAAQSGVRALALLCVASGLSANALQGAWGAPHWAAFIASFAALAAVRRHGEHLSTDTSHALADAALLLPLAVWPSLG